MKAVEDKMRLYKHFIKVLYPKVSYLHQINILILPQIIVHVYSANLTLNNFGTVLGLDKQNELKTSQIK